MGGRGPQPEGRPHPPLRSGGGCWARGGRGCRRGGGCWRPRGPTPAAPPGPAGRRSPEGTPRETYKKKLKKWSDMERKESLEIIIGRSPAMKLIRLKGNGGNPLIPETIARVRSAETLRQIIGTPHSSANQAGILSCSRACFLFCLLVVERCRSPSTHGAPRPAVGGEVQAAVAPSAGPQGDPPIRPL